MPVTLILLSALGPLREALYRANISLNKGHRVIFVCFRQDIADFLEPLRSDEVEIHFHPETLTFDVQKLPHEIAAIKRFKKKLRNLYADLQFTEVWAYASSISLSSILALHFFALRYPVNYNGTYEGRYAKDGIFYQHTVNLWRQLKAKLLSLVSGADIEFVRDWSPVPVLSESYIRKRTRTVTDWPITTPRCELESPLLRPCNQGILLLFTNYSDYYKADEKDRQAFAEFCSTLGKALRETAPDNGVAVKPHPTCSELPPDWEWMERINPGFPLEFLDLSSVRIILGDASTSMLSPLRMHQKPVLSYVNLIDTNWAPKVRAYLDQRVDPEKKVLRPKSWDELKTMIRQVMHV